MFFGGSCNGSHGGWGVGGCGVNDVRCWLPTKVIVRCYDDEQCSIPRARSSLFAKKMMFFGGSCNGSHGGGGGWVGGGLMTCVVDCQQR